MRLQNEIKLFEFKDSFKKDYLVKRINLEHIFKLILIGKQEELFILLHCISEEVTREELMTQLGT